MKLPLRILGFFLTAHLWQAEAATPAVTVSQNSPSVGRYDVYEVTMTDQATYANPWEDVVITAVFTAPSQKSYTVGGFSYDGKHSWKVRFAPMEVGDWTWTLTYQVHDNGGLNGQFTTNGSFSVTLLNSNGVISSGFVKLSPANPYRLVTEADGRTWSPRTLNYDGPEKPANPWRTDEQGMPNSFANYIKCDMAAGMNCFCDDIGYLGYISTWNVNGTGKNIYNAGNCQWWDQFCATTHGTGIKLLHNMFPAQSVMRPWDTADQNYLKYVINRYGAYTDIWQFFIDLSAANIAVADGKSAVTFIKSYDPYQHPISGGPNGTPPSNWDIISGQGYMGNNQNQIDFTQAWSGNGSNGVQQFETTYSRPMLYTEGGTQYWWSVARFRVMTWTAFFTEGGIAWWDGGPDHGGVAGVAHIGPGERAANLIHANFVSDFDPAATPLNLMNNYNGQGQANAVRCWALGSANDIGAYIVNGGDQALLVTGKTVTLTVPQDNMQGVWFDPVTGRVVQLLTVNSGPRTLAIPPFSEGIVLRLRASAPQSWVEFDTSAYDAQDTDSGVTLTVNRFGNGSGAVWVNYSTQDALAQDGVDFQATSGTLTWGDGDVAPKTITVPLLHVPTCKPHRNFNVVLSNSTGTPLGTASRAVVSITNTVLNHAEFDRPYFVGYTANGAMNFTVNRVGDPGGSLSANYVTRDYDAHAGTDYTAVSGTLAWAPGDTTQRVITVPLLQPTIAKVFFMELAAPSPPTDMVSSQGLAYYKPLGWILPPAQSNYTFLSFTGYDYMGVFGSGYPYPVYKVAKSAGSVSIPISRWNTLNDFSATAGLQFTAYASDGSVVGDGGTVAGSEFTAANHVPLNWAAGDSAVKYITVPINPNFATAGAHDFTVGMVAFTNANAWPQTAIISIVDTAPALVTPPNIVVQPVSQTVSDQQPVTFAVVASGTPLAYQWSRNGSPISGATGASYTIGQAQLADTASYAVTVSNSAGSVSSTAVSLTVNPVAPAIAAQPAGLWVLVNQTATFSVAATGTAPLTYQWLKNGSPIGGATEATYTTPALSLADDSAQFSVVVSNGAQPDATSVAAMLRVTSTPVAPSIVTQPANRIVSDGQTATFSAAAAGTGPLTYQWFRNNIAISGAMGSSYTTPPATLADSGAAFRVVIANGTLPNATSATATLTVTPVAPFITTQPAGQTVVAGQTATFNVVAGGSAPHLYRWLKNGSYISGAHGASYTTPATTLADNGARFSVEITDPTGTVSSTVAVLTVNPAPAPAIIAQPSDLMVKTGQQAVFVVQATGQQLSFQWQDKNGNAIPGATSSAYTILSTAANNNGDQFRVVVSNSLGSVTSAYATLTVVASNQAPSITSQPASQIVAVGQTATFSVGVTGTAPLTYAWYKDGSAIANATSPSYTTAPASADDNGAFYAVKITNATGNVTSNSATLTVTGGSSFVGRVNFQPSGSPVPPGYVKDTGALKGANPYGWNVTLGNRDRGTINPDPRLDTFVMSITTATWTYTIANGDYLVTLVCGDPSFQEGPQLITLQGATVVDSQITAANQFVKVTQQVHIGTGALTMTIGGGGGSQYTTPNYLDIQPAPVAPAIAVQPVGATLDAGQPVSFTVQASGTPTPAYQWQLDGKNIGGATSAAYTIGQAQQADTGSYTVFISNSAGAVSTTPVTLTVKAPLNITTASPLPSGTAGITYSQLLASSGGTAPLVWSLANGALPDGLGLTTAGLLGGTPATTGTWNFSAEVTDSVAASTTRTFALTIEGTPLDQWRAANFTPAELADATISGSLADPDGDGVSNLLEYAFHRKPRVADPANLLTPAIMHDVLDNKDYFTVTYTRLKPPLSVSYHVEFSNDLATWSDDTSLWQEVQVIDDSNAISETVVIRANATLDQMTAKFMRLRITSP